MRFEKGSKLNSYNCACLMASKHSPVTYCVYSGSWLNICSFVYFAVGVDAWRRHHWRDRGWYGGGYGYPYYGGSSVIVVPSSYYYQTGYVIWEHESSPWTVWIDLGTLERITVSERLGGLYIKDHGLGVHISVHMIMNRTSFSIYLLQISIPWTLLLRLLLVKLAWLQSFVSSTCIYFAKSKKHKHRR